VSPPPNTFSLISFLRFLENGRKDWDGPGRYPQQRGCTPLCVYYLFPSRSPKFIPVLDREKLQPSMTRYFTKLSVDRPVWRNNFFFQVIDEHTATDIDPLELGWSETMGGPEDRSKPKRVFPSIVQPSTIIYRSERQTLRRLPRTGAVVFTCVYFRPLK
jgi:hypothetical protein